MKIRPLFAWYDLWVGAYWDRHNRCLYVLPLPMLGVVIDFSKPPCPACYGMGIEGVNFETSEVTPCPHCNQPIGEK